MNKLENGFFSNQKLIIILTLVGIITPIAWDQFQSSSELTLAKLQTSYIIDPKTQIDGLKVYYDKKPIQNLSTSTLQLKNTGQKPIIESDVIEPLVVSISDGVVLNSTIEHLEPNNINASVTAIKNSVALSFKLLNPGESITFNILTDSSNLKTSASSRIRNISYINVVDNQNKSTTRRHIGIHVYITAFFSLFCMILVYIYIRDIKARNIELKLARSNNNIVKPDIPVELINNYLKQRLDFISDEQLEFIHNQIPSQTKTLNEIQAKILNNVILNAIESEDLFTPMLILLAIMVVGFAYVIANIF